MAEFSYPQMDSAQLHHLRQKIRAAQEPDNPDLIRQWITLGQASVQAPLELRRRICIDQFYLLLEVVADDCLPAHWRNSCLDHINRTVLTLKQLADDQHSSAMVQRLFYELRVTSHFFQTALSQFASSQDEYRFEPPQNDVHQAPFQMPSSQPAQSQTPQT